MREFRDREREFVELPPSVSNSTAFSAALGLNPRQSSSKSTSTSTEQAPQFITPRLSMATKPPFTEEGLALGKLKILVAGDSGAGKSQLIKTLTQTCKHIVHANDTCNSIASATEKSLYDNLDLNPEHQNALWEQLASTKPQPFFLSDSRRMSVVKYSMSTASEGVTLDRNICFVDTIGYGSFSSATNCITPIVSYLESTFEKALSLINPASDEALSVLTSSASLTDGSLVDVCLYTILNRLKPIDVEYIKKLSQYTSVIPVIVKSDLLPPKDILELKLSILTELNEQGITPFLFGTTVEEAIASCETKLRELEASASTEDWDSDSDSSYVLSSSCISINSDPKSESDINRALFPCAVSTALDKDAELVASVLMAPNYVPALQASELEDLSAHLFSSHGAAWLRYTAGTKFLSWAASRQAEFSMLAEPQTQIVCRETCTDLVCTDDADVGFEIPNYIFEARRKAQMDTSKWVAKLAESMLKQESGEAGQSRPVLSLRTVNNSVVAVKRAVYPGSSSARSGLNQAGFRHSLSIMNLDPLDLWGTSWSIFSYAIKAVVVAVGYKIVIHLSHYMTASSPSAQPVPLDRPSSQAGGAVLTTVTSFAERASDPAKQWMRPQSFFGALLSGQYGSEGVMSTIMVALGGFWSRIL